MAPQVGLEPTTDRLTADCSTTELLRNSKLISCKKQMHVISTLYIIFTVLLKVKQKLFFFIFTKKQSFQSNHGIKIYHQLRLSSNFFKNQFPSTTSTHISFCIKLLFSYINITAFYANIG